MKKKGGSIASDRVNSLSPKLCNSYPKFPTTNETNINRCFAINNYATTYKTTGGSSNKNLIRILPPLTIEKKHIDLFFNSLKKLT